GSSRQILLSRLNLCSLSTPSSFFNASLLEVVLLMSDNISDARSSFFGRLSLFHHSVWFGSTVNVLSACTASSTSLAARARACSASSCALTSRLCLSTILSALDHGILSAFTLSRHAAHVAFFCSKMRANCSAISSFCLSMAVAASKRASASVVFCSFPDSTRDSPTVTMTCDGRSGRVR
ncbi:hypothetical protein PMAYCL1PPCAC_14149, partial [Pristionchus mayeri]